MAKTHDQRLADYAKLLEKMVADFSAGILNLTFVSGKDLFFIQLYFYKNKQIKQVMEIAKIAKERRVSGWHFTGRML